MANEEAGSDLSAYLDGELDPARREEIERHVASCERCRTELERLRKVKALVGGLPRSGAPGCSGDIIHNLT